MYNVQLEMKITYTRYIDKNYKGVIFSSNIFYR